MELRDVRFRKLLQELHLVSLYLFIYLAFQSPQTISWL
jgi:hypothetical protein